MKRFFRFIFGKDKEPEPKPSIEIEPEVQAPEEKPKEVKPKAVLDVVERLTSKKKKSRKFNYHEGCLCPSYKVPEAARKKLPKLRQVELARPTQTSYFGEEPLMPIERLKIKRDTSEEKKCPDSKRMHKLAAPRQNWREIRKKQIEEGNKIFTVSKSALRAVASPRIIELAKPKRIRKKIIKYKKIKKRYAYVPVIPKKKRKKKPEQKKELVKKPSLLHLIEEFGRDILKPPQALTSDYSRRMEYVMLPDFPFEGIEVKARETEAAEEEPRKRPTLADIIEDYDKTELSPPSPVDSVFKRRKSYILLPDFPFEGIELKQEEGEEEETKKNLQISLADIIADIDKKELEPPVAVDSEFPRRRSYVLLPDFPFEGIEDAESEAVEPKRRPSLADVIEETDLKEFSPPPPLDSEYTRRKSYVLLPEFPFEGIECSKAEEHIEDTEFEDDDNKIDEEKALQEYIQICAAFEDFSKHDKAIKKKTSLSPHPDTTALQDTDEKECNLDETKQNDFFTPYPEIPALPQETDVKEDNQNIVEQDHTLTSGSEMDAFQNIEAGTCEDMTPDSLLIPDSETSVVGKTEDNICNIEDTVKDNNETTDPTNVIAEDIGNISEIENSFQENVMLSSVSESNKDDTPIMVKTDFPKEPQHISPENPDVVTNLKVNVLVDHLKQPPVSQPDKNETTVVADDLAEKEPPDKDETVVADHLTKSELPDSQLNKNETIIANHFIEKEPPVCQSDKDETVVADHLTESEPSDSQPDKNKTIVADHLTKSEPCASEADGKNAIFIDQFTELKPPPSESNKNENDFEDNVKEQPVSEPNKIESLETSNIKPTGVEEVDDNNQKIVTNLGLDPITDKKEEEDPTAIICAFCKQKVSSEDNKCLCVPYMVTEKIEEDTEDNLCGLTWMYQ